jgi:hypothetical protein
VPAHFVSTVIRAAAARADGTLLDRPPPTSAVPILQHPTWQGDEEARVLARRDPINDDDQATGALVYLDRLSRPSWITDASYDLWRSHLHPEDLVDPGVAGFIRWHDAERAER